MNVPAQHGGRTARDPRLDFFRGLGMFIILIAHISWNKWSEFIPARFGYSDAADMFVFCSGMASALAFGSVYVRRGWFMGTARIVYRVWQVYWAHIGSVLVIAALLAGVDGWLGGDKYVSSIRLNTLFDDTATRLVEIMTLRYLPEFLDILPMYLVILAMVPVFMGLAQLHKALAIGFIVLLWSLANIWDVNLVADRQVHKPWYFNPFGWQVVFFTGFMLMRGWFPLPPRDWRLVAACLAIVIVSMPLACNLSVVCSYTVQNVPAVFTVSKPLLPFVEKTSYGILRYVHFMATVYLAWGAVGEGGRRLKGVWVAVMCKVGQQTLAVFLTGLVMARVLSIVLDFTGRGIVATALVNVAGIASLIAAAYITGWFKSAPWRVTARPRPAHALHDAAAPGEPSVPAAEIGQRVETGDMPASQKA